ncbi:WD40-repeat-containing domain protein [Phycomyces nitens]|nr:WD40-repeat-containing domain protein [Phycomyces nitens]
MSAFCNRHRSPTDVHDHQESKELEQALTAVPPNDRPPIQQIWSMFESASATQRLLILQGLLSTCCTSQLSFLSNTIQPLLRVDFTTILPSELTFQIFRHLDAQSLCNAAQVSHGWKILANDDSLWHRMCVQHIDRKCTKCGWGLPLLRKQARAANKRPREVIEKEEEEEEDEEQKPSTKRVDRKAWKEVYSERLVVERHWRKNQKTYKILKGGHTKGITCLQFCESLNLVMTGSHDKTAVVWDLETGEKLRTLNGHARSVSSLQFDTTKLVTASMDHTLRVWNYRTGQCIRTLQGHTDGVVHINFDCRILASGSADATIKIWNFQTGECYTLSGHTQRVNHVQIQHNSTILVSSSDDSTIRIWDLVKRQCTRVLQGHRGSVQTAIPSMPGFVHRFDQVKSEEEEKPTDCDSASGSQVVISGSLDNTLKVWSLDTGDCVRTLFGHSQGITSLDYDKLHLVSGSQDGGLKIWDIESGFPMHSVHKHSAAVTAVSLSDTKVVSASDDGEVHIWDYGVHA